MEEKVNTVENENSVWECTVCGFNKNVGKFCKSCGTPKAKPEEITVITEEIKEREKWSCIQCGAENTRNFCYKCGRKKPIQVFHFQCKKCGWTPDETETFTPNFCPECGDPIEDEDTVVKLV